MKVVFPYLSILILLPIFSSLFVILSDSQNFKNARNIGLCSSIASFFVSMYLYFNFENSYGDFQFVEKYEWIKSFKTSFHLGVDSLSIYFVILVSFVSLFSILCLYVMKIEKIKEYVVCFLFLQSFSTGCFCALDILLFYVFFESVLIPMFIIIGIWGGELKLKAAFRFFIYTLFGSLFMLFAFVKIYNHVLTTNMLDIYNYHFSVEVQIILFIALFIAFAVKIPIFPFHTWLPLVHTEAPTAGSMFLAGILLKLGAYGLLRIVLPLLPEASIIFAPYVIGLGIIGVIYASMVALVQDDMKKMIAYSSIAHMAFVILGIFSFTRKGFTGAVMQMLSHGVISAGLFFCIGIIYDKFKTREIKFYGGLSTLMPYLSVCFFIISLGAIAVPGTFGFVGEFLILMGIIPLYMPYSFLVLSGVILGAVYMLNLNKNIFFGELSKKVKLMLESDLAYKKDKNTFENNNVRNVMLSTMCFIIITAGFYPSPYISTINQAYNKIVMKIRKSNMFKGNKDEQ
ncbi:MAG: NADH-quinone oxidoreductase subunit M [Candidatus Puniceispirillum sp.]|nr:NADH-quinone oxidoreductase subunit M [Candidatus Pelagibacter sp.]MBA4282823.1 NADH-quinone oxidoreductase subunit M [Candidatus Puniceispirillum sp.]